MDESTLKQEDFSVEGQLSACQPVWGVGWHSQVYKFEQVREGLGWSQSEQL